MRPRARTLLLTAVLACSGTDDGAVTTPPPPSADACAVRPATAIGPPSSTQVTGLCIAESTDGLSFTVLGTAFPFAAGEFFTDPSLVAGANLFIFKTAD
jgi:hypothetical protein